MMAKKLKIIFNHENSIVESQLESKRNLYITATVSLRKFRAEKMADFFNDKKNKLYSYNRYKSELNAAVRSTGGYITYNDQIYILAKVIESSFPQPEQQDVFSNCRWELMKLYSAFLQRDIKEFNDEIIQKIALEKSDSIADIFKLYNNFLIRLNQVKAADDSELFNFDNQEGDFQLQHEIYRLKQKSLIDKYSTVILDGFLFFSDEQKHLIKDAVLLGKQVIIITKPINLLKDNIYEPLGKELGVEIEYIDNQPDTKTYKNNIAEVAENLFTNKKVSGFDGIKFIEPFINHDYEFRYIARDISNRLKALNGNLEEIFKLISEITIVFGTDLSERMDDVFKEESIFILKDRALDKSAPHIVYSKDEFLQWESNLNRTEKVRFFENNYARLRLNTRKRSFILYPIGQYICEIYNIISKGITVESYKKILYSNWQYSTGESDERYDKYIKDFAVIEPYFRNKDNLDEWIIELRNIKKIKKRTQDDFAYNSHPFRVVSHESLAFIETHMIALKAIVGELSAIKGTLTEHIEGLKSLFRYDAENVRDEKDIVNHLKLLIEEIATSSMLNMDAKYFGENIKAMLMEYEQDVISDEEEYDLTITTSSLENAMPYSIVYFPMFEASKYPKPYKQDFPFNQPIMDILNNPDYGINFGLSKSVDLEYYLEVEKFLMKNVLDFTKEEIVFTYSQSDRGIPMYPSIYKADIQSLGLNIPFTSDKTTTANSVKSDLTNLIKFPIKLKSCRLSELLSYYICPKMFYELNNNKYSYINEFHLNLYAAGIVYYKFYERMAKLYPNRIFKVDNELAQMSREVLLELVKIELDAFSCLTSLEKNDIFYKTYDRIIKFYTNILNGKRFKTKSFKFDWQPDENIEIDGLSISIPGRVVINAENNRRNEFDVSKHMEFLLLSGSGRKNDIKHYHEAINILEKYDNDDDRISLVATMYFKITTQLCYEQFREDGILRIKELVREIKNKTFTNFSSLPNDYCKCCKIKHTCREV